MGLYMNQKDNRSELQQRLDAQLRAKAAERLKQETEAPDGIEDSAFIEHTKRTTTLAWAWVFIVLFAIGIFVMFVVRVNQAQ